MTSIEPITPEMLHDEFLRTQIYPDLERTLYWSHWWHPDFYVALARAGFISIAIDHEEFGPLLLPELQESYAVLDWENLHCSQNLRRLMRSQRLADEDVELRVAESGKGVESLESVERVMERIFLQHPDSWMLAPYQELVRELAAAGDVHFSICGVELWSGKRNELVAGELGYTIGASYTSLSGFCSPHDPALRHFGTLQMFLLAERLRERGYAFWNMGHSVQSYKREIGARILARPEFLSRWLDARAAVPTAALNSTGP